MKLKNLTYPELSQETLVELVTCLLEECRIDEEQNGISPLSTVISEVVDRFVEREELKLWTAKHGTGK